MRIYTKDCNHIPYIVEEKGTIIEVNEQFLELSGFSKEEILNKPFKSIVNNLLHIDENLLELETKCEAFLFTKFFEARNVIIEKDEFNGFGKVKYYIEEMPNSRFGERNLFLERLIDENKIGICIFSA